MNSQRQRHRGRSRQSTSDVDLEHRLWLAFSSPLTLNCREAVFASAKPLTRLTMRRYGAHTYPGVRFSCSRQTSRMIICSKVRRGLQEVRRRAYGCAFRSTEGGKAAGCLVLQRRILVAVEFLLAALPHGRGVRSAGREARYRL